MVRHQLCRSNLKIGRCHVPDYLPNPNILAATTLPKKAHFCAVKLHLFNNHYFCIDSVLYHKTFLLKKDQKHPIWWVEHRMRMMKLHIISRMVHKINSNDLCILSTRRTRLGTVQSFKCARNRDRFPSWVTAARTRTMKIDDVCCKDKRTMASCPGNIGIAALMKKASNYGTQEIFIIYVSMHTLGWKGWRSSYCNENSTNLLNSFFDPVK